MLSNFDGPIPGENYTSDTKNYPWHRPPEITDYDQGVEYIIQKMTEPETGYGFLPLFEAGYSVATAADIFVTEGIMEGKWTPDYALLLAGPAARMLQIIARSQGLEPELGVDKPIEVVSPDFLRSIRGDIVEEPMDEMMEESLEDAPMLEIAGGGFMAAPEIASANEQMEMLGYGGADIPPPVEEVM